MVDLKAVQELSDTCDEGGLLQRAFEDLIDEVKSLRVQMQEAEGVEEDLTRERDALRTEVTRLKAAAIVWRDGTETPEPERIIVYREVDGFFQNGFFREVTTKGFWAMGDEDDRTWHIHADAIAQWCYHRELTNS